MINFLLKDTSCNFFTFMDMCREDTPYHGQETTHYCLREVQSSTLLQQVWLNDLTVSHVPL